MKVPAVILFFVVSATLISCGKAAEDKTKMHQTAQHVSDSIEKAIDGALNSVSITPQPAQPHPADTAKK